MKAVIQRVSDASVAIDGKIKASIGRGLMMLVGFEDADTEDDLDWMVRKVMNLRIFNDDEGVMNLSVKDVQGEALIISQFTLHASTRKGNRPSYIHAAKPPVAIPLYERFLILAEQELGKTIGSGTFGADMKVALVNDGPVTIIIDTKQKD